VKRGETIVLHAAAGGVGLIACQWAKHLGATVIGTAGSEEKAAVARAHGCDHVILYNQEDVAARCARADRRPGRAGGLRRRRQGHLRRLARLPGPARPAGGLRQRLGCRASARHPLAQQQGLALPDAPHARPLRRHPRDPARRRRRAVRGGARAGRPHRGARRRFP
jgi:hypothetical protein